VIGNPLETAIALHYLIFDGVLERHPRLKILAAHGGGYLASYAGRIDHAWGARSDSHGTLPHPPTAYLRRIYFDSVVFTGHQLRELVRLYGADHFVMGTDYPFDMGEYDPVGHVCDAGLEEPQLQRCAAAPPGRCCGCEPSPPLRPSGGRLPARVLIAMPSAVPIRAQSGRANRRRA